jgi:hypothetical protein
MDQEKSGNPAWRLAAYRGVLSHRSGETLDIIFSSRNVNKSKGNTRRPFFRSRFNKQGFFPIFSAETFLPAEARFPGNVRAHCSGDLFFFFYLDQRCRSP